MRHVQDYSNFIKLKVLFNSNVTFPATMLHYLPVKLYISLLIITLMESKYKKCSYTI